MSDKMNKKELLKSLHYQIKEGAKIVLLNPIPDEQKQIGGTCGYSAMSIISDYWNKKNPNVPFIFSRKKLARENSSHKSAHPYSFRELGKSIVPTKDAIFNMSLFKDVFEKTENYTSKLYEFNSLSDCLKIVTQALKSGFPIIFPMDRASKIGKSIAMKGGYHAHYVTLIGLVEKNGKTYCVFSDHGSYRQVDFGELYASCMNLDISPGFIAKERKKGAPQSYVTPPVRLDNIDSYDIPLTQLNNMRGKLVIPFPNLYQSEYSHLETKIEEICNVTQKTDEKVVLRKFPSRDKNKDIHPRSQLSLAISTHDNELAKSLIEDAIKQNAITQRELSNMLDIAITNDNKKMVRYLLQYHLDINKDNKRGESPLYIALVNGHYDMVYYLIDKGAHLNYVNRYGQSLLHLAIINNHNHVSKFLIKNTFVSKNGTDVNFIDQSGETPLCKAIKLGNDDVVLYLLKKWFTKVNRSDKDGYNPLYHALEKKNYFIADKLIEAGADINKRNKDDNTLLLLAVKENDYHAVKYLIKKGASLNYTDKQGRTPLYMAVCLENNKIAKCLIQSGAKINYSNNNGKTPLHKAIELGNNELVECLLKNKADVNHTTNMGESPLSLAIDLENPKLVKLLLANKKLDKITTLNFFSHKKHLSKKINHSAQKYIENEGIKHTK
ncbi:MAG: ankyrin repeat domain-containing protein [Legionella longbeachae]|nr:ankyrin repeat domain-containing protein [Legionella longbeachae]